MKNIIKDRGSIYCNENAWDTISDCISELMPSKIFIIVDANTETHCLPYFIEKIKVNHDFHVLSIPTGEKHKTIDTCLTVWNELSIKGADRKSLLINLGGGVVTDLGGFVAATFRRGIEFINIPTSLLAMVDASLGGKNGVDLGNLKNQVGIIRNPLCVVIDTNFLKTLAEKEVTSGYAEMLKHGIIYSEAYWEKLKLFDISNIIETQNLIWESVEIKNQVVSEDPNEIGIRKSLNYGHTLGHAIESYCLENTNKPSLLHGEAVAIGMILATFLSSVMFKFPESKLDKVTEVILSKFPKIEFENSDIEEIIKLLIYDKKNSNGKVFFVLLNDFGKHKIDCLVPNSLIYKAFSYYRNYKYLS